MLFAAYGRFRTGTDVTRAGLSEVFSSHLQQPFLRIHLAGPLRNAEGEKVGILVLIESPTREAVSSFIASSPFSHAHVYSDVFFEEFSPEVGVI